MEDVHGVGAAQLAPEPPREMVDQLVALTGATPVAVIQALRRTDNNPNAATNLLLDSF